MKMWLKEFYIQVEHKEKSVIVAVFEFELRYSAM